ncbi:hypothetical protein HDC93_004084 [Streptomyces sp. AK010]|nr:hypothetical protein [Streptomyces sp. AK010]
MTEVLGDLDRADRVAVLVPGSDTGLDTYGPLRDRTQAAVFAYESGLVRPSGY